MEVVEKEKKEPPNYRMSIDFKKCGNCNHSYYISLSLRCYSYRKNVTETFVCDDYD